MILCSFLTEDEIKLMVSQNVIPSKQSLGGAKPFVFTESGVAMLSSVLKSKRAKEMNIAIMRTFVMLRKKALDHTEALLACCRMNPAANKIIASGVETPPGRQIPIQKINYKWVILIPI